MSYLTPEQINASFPIVGFLGYQGGIIIQRGCNCDLIQGKYQHIRGGISMVSRRSLYKLALLVKSSTVEFKSVMTVTYGQNYPLSGRIAKRHLNAFLVGCKRVFGPFDYVWVTEFQERGAVHFHIATSLEAPTKEDLHQFAVIWTRISIPGDWLYSELIWNGKKFVGGRILGTMMAGLEVHTHKRAWEKLRKDDGIGRYMAKYASKIRQKKVPEWYSDVGRFWGASRGVKLPDDTFYSGNDTQVRSMLALANRDVSQWRVLPRIVLL